MTSTTTRTSQPTIASTSTWKIDPSHSDVGFAVKHLMIANVRGRFSAVQGQIDIDEGDIERSRVTVEIDTASIDTREARRDEHLRSADFFDVALHPHIVFESNRVQSAGKDRFRVSGMLTIRDVTRPVTLEVREEGRGQDPWGNARAAFSATTTIDRREFGLTWNQALETGGVLVGNDVRISMEIEAIKA